VAQSETALKYPAPACLGDDGAALWASIVKVYELRLDELVTLEDICASTDVIASLDKMWRDLGQPVITTGSMGQEVEHPLIGSIDKQRKARNALWRQLKLPDAGEAASAGESNQHRAAAQSKWAAAHGKGA
jgi:hypothetical protein